MAWTDTGLPVIVSVTDYWTVTDATVLFSPLTAREIRVVITRAGLPPAGRRPHAGRGRAPLVYPAGELLDLLTAL